MNIMKKVCVCGYVWSCENHVYMGVSHVMCLFVCFCACICVYLHGGLRTCTRVLVKQHADGFDDARDTHEPRCGSNPSQSRAR